MWPALGWEARTIALRQLWARAQVVHSVDFWTASAMVSSRSPFYASTPAEALEQLARLGEVGALARGQVEVLSTALDRFWAVVGRAPCVLNHGDLCPENALWHCGSVIALLDFEFAVIAPVELDLNELLKCAYAPPEQDDPLPDSDGSGRERLRQAVSDIAVSAVQTPDGPDLLLGFAILLELSMMENWLARWNGHEPFVEWQPYKTLKALADGYGGYLAPVLTRVARA
jgi:scyllo-inosamine 4-kinase